MGWRGRVSAGAIGLLSVLMGIGGGSFGVPIMTLHGVAIHRAVATAAGFGVAIAAPSVLAFLFLPLEGPVPPFTIGAVNLVAFAIIVPAAALSAPWGSAIAYRVRAPQLKRGFGVFLLLIAGNMMWEVIGP